MDGRTKERIAYDKVIKELPQAIAHPLNPVTVHYVNRALENQFTLPLHGYTAVESMPRSLKVSKTCLPKEEYQLKKKFAEVFYLGPSEMHIPFDVSPALVETANKDAELTDTTKKALAEMAGKKFPFVGNFLRELLEKIAPDYIHFATFNPKRLIWKLEKGQQIALCKELICLVSINEKAHSQSILSLVDIPTDLPMLPFQPSRHFCAEDREAFEQKNCTSTPYSLISPTAVYELFRQQYIFQYYIEDKTGLGESKDELSAKNRDQILKRLVHYADVPIPNYAFFSNCNKATATFLQEAANLSVQKEKISVTGTSLVSIGSSQRMFLWGSKRQQAVVDLFINRALKEEDKTRAVKLKNNPQLRSQLAQDKYYILEVIETWPIEQQVMALEQIQNPNTPLGVVFSTPRNTFLPAALSLPDKSKGLLKVAADRLESLKTQLKFLKTQPSPK